MKGGKDEGKPMDPLFPRLHIDDANKGGPRPPPRNKMALCDQYDLPSPSSIFSSGTITSSIRFAPQTSASNIGSSKQKLLFPTFNTSPPHLVDRCHSNSNYSDALNGKISAPNSKPSPPVNFQVQCVSGKMMSKAIDCNSSQQRSFLTSNTMRHGEENVYRVPPLPQLQSDQEKCSVVQSGGELLNACLKEQKNMGCERISNLFQPVHTQDEKPGPVFQIGDRVSKDAALQFRSVKHHEPRRNMEENKDDTHRMPERILRKRCYSAIDDMPCPYPLREDTDRLIKNESVKEHCDNEEFDPIGVPKDENGQENSDTSEGESVQGLALTPDDVAEVIGQRLFWKARKMIVYQQHLFAVQIFELHRLVKVQSLIAGSLESQKNNSNLKKPYIKFPPMNKLLYVTPLDQSSPIVTKPKPSNLKLNGDRDPCNDSKAKQPPPLMNNIDKGFTSQQSSPKPMIFHSLPANQWLVPVRSPSEGLIYKPYAGPCPPPFGVMAPIYGNCAPIRLSNVGGPTAYGVPASNIPGVGRFPGTSLSQNYFQPYHIPLLKSSCPSVEIEQSSGVVSECEENNTTSPSEKVLGEELSLFPTTPSVEFQKDQEKEQAVQVIKVVPHNPRSASESAARIFQSIQEERKAT